MVEISNTSLISDLTTKIGNKVLFILRNRVHSFVAENWAHERRVPILQGQTKSIMVFLILAKLNLSST